MYSHLFKLTGFFAVQAALFLVVQGTAPARPEPLASADSLHRQRLTATLANELFHTWRADSKLLVTAAQPGAVDPRIERVFEHFRSTDDHYLLSLSDKENRLRTTAGRRLIVVGGSNVAFGVDSVLLCERYGLEPVNLGVHGGLGGAYLLKQTSAHVRRGDVVVLCLEYQSLRCGLRESRSRLAEQACALVSTVRPYFATMGEHVVESTASGAPENLPTASDVFGWKEYSDKQALADLCAQMRDRLERSEKQCRWWYSELVDGRESLEAQNRRFQRELAEAAPKIAQNYDDWKEATYLRSNFNSYGDMVAHHGGSSSRVIQPVNSRPLNTEECREIERSITVLNQYAARWRSMGADVYFAYPPLHQPTGEFPQQFEALLAANLEVPILFSIEQAATGAGDLFDTENHLNWPGICRRMQILTSALDRHLPPRVATSPAEHVAQREASQRLRLASRTQAGRVQR